MRKKWIRFLCRTFGHRLDIANGNGELVYCVCQRCNCLFVTTGYGR
jgi:hypothetical protein